MQVNALTIDLEDWYQSTFDPESEISHFCVKNTKRVLELLDKYNVKATFFVQGMVARKYPEIVKLVKEKGHEIQSHGYSHRPLNKLSPEEIKKELLETKKILEDITGKEVIGFRAPDFSIDKKRLWIFEIMAECGIKYDSSIFPVRTRRYGINNFERGYSKIITKSGVIEELPVSILKINLFKQINIPVGGGGYFRLFPYKFLSFSLDLLNKKNLPFVVYCHPYEFNHKELSMLEGVTLFLRLHQGIGRKGFAKKLSKLLQKAKFTTISKVIEIFRNNSRSFKTVYV